MLFPLRAPNESQLNQDEKAVQHTITNGHFHGLLRLWLSVSNRFHDRGLTLHDLISAAIRGASGKGPGETPGWVSKVALVHRHILRKS